MGFFKRLFGLGLKPAAGTVPAEPAGDAAADLPSPPVGFTWHSFKDARITVLRPDGWYGHHVDNDDSFTGCISKESISSEGSFKTGLTLLVFRQIKDRPREENPNDDPGVPVLGVFLARHRSSLFSDPCKTVLYCDQAVQKTGHFRSFRFQYRHALPGNPPIIVQKFLIDVDDSNDVYEFVFESPESEWAENWQKGRQILRELVFSLNDSTNLMFSVDPPLPPDDVLHAKTLEAGQAMGWSLAYENRSEGLFLWRVQLPAPDGEASVPIGCCFSWYIKHVHNEIWADDSLQFEPRSMSTEVMEQLAAAARSLQEDFKRRWLALVGPVTLRGASPETHSSELQVRAMTALLMPGKK
jgi:hypothetical protein